jgi:hypothetical protein
MRTMNNCAIEFHDSARHEGNRPIGLWAAGSMDPVFRCGEGCFNGQNQFFWGIHFPSGPDADEYIDGRFTYNLAKHRDMTLADDDEHDHWFSEPRRIRGRTIFRSLCDHAGGLL